MENLRKIILKELYKSTYNRAADKAVEREDEELVLDFLRHSNDMGIEDGLSYDPKKVVHKDDEHIVIDKDLVRIVRKTIMDESNTYDGAMERLGGFVSKPKKEIENYMFFQNLKEIRDNIDIILKMNESEIDQILSNGHDWATEHITTAKDDIEEVTNFLKYGK